MTIKDIQVGFPSSAVSNADIIELVKTHSTSKRPILNEITNNLAAFFSDSGANTRLWRELNESPHDILINTGNKILENVDRTEIDVVIFCSVTKYFAEPAHSSFFCRDMKLKPKYSFDISDGCMGWMTALSLLYDMSNNHKFRYGLIIAHEFPMHENGAIYPKSFKINSLKELSYKAPALTLGEVCCLTLVELGKNNNSMNRKESPTGADYCTMPFRNFKDFSGSSEYIKQVEEFHAYFTELSKSGAKSSLELLNKNLGSKDINLAVHSYTKSFERFKKFLNFDVNLLNYFDEYGNLASATIPTNIWLAKQRQELEYEKAVYAWCASAGTKAAIMEIKLDANFNL